MLLLGLASHASAHSACDSIALAIPSCGVSLAHQLLFNPANFFFNRHPVSPPQDPRLAALIPTLPANAQAPNQPRLRAEPRIVSLVPAVLRVHSQFSQVQM